MFECTVVTCLCSEASPRVNCIFHKYQTFGNNYCKAFGCLKAYSFVNGPTVRKRHGTATDFFWLSLFPKCIRSILFFKSTLKGFFALYEFKTSLNNHCFSCLKNMLLSVLVLVIKSKISGTRHFLNDSSTSAEKIL